MIENRIKEIRHARKMTVRELAEVTKLSRSYVTMLENGDRTLDLELMVTIAAALNVKPYELMPVSMQPEEITPEEREILRMIRKTSAPQNPNNKNLPQQNQTSKGR